jgi:hypothetical protein
MTAPAGWTRADFVVVAASLASLALGCESREAAERRVREVEEQARPLLRGNRPDALMIRFEAHRGAGFSREGWELEMLQLGSDVRLRGSIRSAGQISPVYGSLEEAEYADLWSWIAGLPLDRFRVTEDSTAADDGWTRRLEVDIVVGPERRIVSRNEWRRKASGAPWLLELESAMQALATEHAAPTDSVPHQPDSTREAVSKAIEGALQELQVPRPQDAASSP